MIARRVGAVVGGAAAHPGDGAVPLHLLMSALFGGAGGLLDREQLGTLPSQPEERYWLVEAIGSRLQLRAREQPLAILLDDVHATDDASLAAIEVLGARLADEPVAWFVTTAAGHARRLALPGAVRLELGALAESAVAEVVADHLGAPAEPALLELVRGCHGSPFWLNELLLGVAEDGSTLRRVPKRVRALVRELLDGLSAPARRAASVAAALGRTFEFEALARMLAVAPRELLGPVEELLGADVFAEIDGVLEFTNELLREAVLDGVPGSARMALQREAVTVLLEGGATSITVAEQLASSARPGDARAIDVLTQAVTTLGASDPYAAAELGRRTLRLVRRDDPGRGELIAETAMLLHDAGHAEVGRSFAEQALADVPPVSQEARVRLGIAAMFGLSAETRIRASRTALALPGLGDADRARQHAALAHNLVAAGHLDEAEALLQVSTSEERDAQSAYAHAVAVAGVAHARGDLEAALVRLDQLARDGAPSGERARAVVATRWRAEALTALDRSDEAVAVCVNGLEQARSAGQAWAASAWQQLRGRQQLRLGELRAAIATLHDLALTGTLEPVGLAALAQSALHVGDQRLLDSCAGLARELLERDAPSDRRHAAWLLAQQAMAAGDSRGGLALLRLEGGEPPATDATDGPRLVRLAIAAGEGALAEHAAAAAKERARRTPAVASIRGAALHAQGLLDDDPTALAGAIAALAVSPRRVALCSALEDAGCLATRRGEHQEAIELLGRALELAVELDATWDATRIRSRLRTLGVRRRVTRVRAVAEGMDALTTAERAIALAVSRGMTNKEVAEHLFISPHTVNSHLRNVFAKLDVNSRVELTRLATASPVELEG